MSTETNRSINLSNPNYISVLKDGAKFYGGSQMWFSEKNWFSKDYILHNYGCGTIAAADLLLYLAMQNEALRSPETEIALHGSATIDYINYDPYVRTINRQYTKTCRFIAVLGPLLAAAINSYTNANNFPYNASWKWRLGYYDMLNILEEMISEDIPAIISIGPNTPKLWGKKGISFYKRIDVETSEMPDKPSKKTPTHYYKASQENINGHYVTVTGILKDDVVGAIMLCISSWGRQYYVNYEEYRNYIETFGGTFTSSMVYIKQIIW